MSGEAMSADDAPATVRIAALFAELRIINAEEAEFNDAARDLLIREARMLFRDASTNWGSPTYRLTVSWWNGCHCHGREGSENLEAATIEEMAEQVADHEHGEAKDVNEITWSSTLTEEERTAFAAAFASRTAANTERAKAAAEHKATLERARTAADALKRAQDDLADRRHELTDIAIAAREAEIAVMRGGP